MSRVSNSVLGSHCLRQSPLPKSHTSNLSLIAPATVIFDLSVLSNHMSIMAIFSGTAVFDARAVTGSEVV